MYINMHSNFLATHPVHEVHCWARGSKDKDAMKCLALFSATTNIWEALILWIKRR